MGQTKSRFNDEAIILKQEKNTRAFGRVGLCETKGTRRPLIAFDAQYSKREPQFYLDLNHPNLVQPLVYDAHFKEFLGLNAQGVTFYFDYLDVSLEDIIQSRKVRNSIFPEQEILNVGLSILSTLLYLKEYDIEGGNIEPCTIFYDKGQIKIYINQLMLGRVAPYNMIINQFQRKPLPSPEVLYATKNRGQQGLDLVEKYRYETDIFTLGLTLLEMATLEKSSDLFKMEIQQVNVKVLDQRYAILKQRYSERLNNLIRQMLTMDPRNRPTCENLINQIRSGVVTIVPAAVIPRVSGFRSNSQSRALNSSFLDTSQIPGLKTSNLYTQPVIVNGGSRIASVERRGSLTGTHPLTTPSGSRIIQVLPPQQQVQTEGPSGSQTPQVLQQQEGEEIKQNEQQQDNVSIRSVPQQQQVMTEASHRHHIQQKSITSHPQIHTQSIPQNYFVNGRLPPQYLTPQNVRYIPAPSFQTQRGSISNPAQQQLQQFKQQQPQQIQQQQQQNQYYSVQQQKPVHPISHPIQISSRGNQIRPQTLSYTSSVQNLHPSQHPHNVVSNQVPLRNVISHSNIPPQNIQRQGGSFIQYANQPPVYAQQQPINPQYNYQQPIISSPQVQRNQINNLLQNHQVEQTTRMQSLGQKVQELDERVSQSIANSVKVTQQHQNEIRQNDESIEDN